MNQLREFIVTDLALSDEDRADALQQVQALAEAGKNPNDGNMKKLARGAMRMLRGIADELPAATQLIEAVGTLFPAIAILFGL